MRKRLKLPELAMKKEKIKKVMRSDILTPIKKRSSFAWKKKLGIRVKAIRPIMRSLFIPLSKMRMRKKLKN